MAFRGSRAFLAAFLLRQAFFPAVEANVLGLSLPLRPLVNSSWVHIKDLKASLTAVVKDARLHLHRYAADVNVDKTKELLRPMYMALPKNRKGLLDHATARYALHRYFLFKHAMYINGLEPSRDNVNGSSTIIEDNEVPTFIQQVFEERLHDGFDLGELATMAAALEHVVHKESISRLGAAYVENSLDIHRNVTLEQLDRVMDTYLLGLLGDGNTCGPDAVQRARGSLPMWSEAERFLRAAVANVTARTVGAGAPRHAEIVPYGVAVRCLAFFTESFGVWQDVECRSMTQELSRFEVQGTGRVRLADFYRAGWRYKEAKEYLLATGAAEEIRTSNDGDAREARVIIPNYVTARANCIASTQVYHICCIDQCEMLLAALENEVAAPTAKACQIADVVSRLPSASVEAPRALSESLMLRLHRISQAHRGKVPLHSRLFAQWMHYAYPRECPFPAVSGSTKPMSAADWMNATKTNASLTQEEVDEFVRAATVKMEAEVKSKDLVDSDWGSTLPWLDEEELVFWRPQASLSHEFRVIFRAVSILAVMAGTINAVISTLFFAKRASFTGVGHKEEASKL